MLAASNGLGAQQRTDPVASASCVPTRLVVAFANIDINLIPPPGWPQALEVLVNDDCANPLTVGAVIAIFSNGDPALSLVSLGDGRWEATFVSFQTAASQLIIQVSATDPLGHLKGRAQTSILTRGLGLSQTGFTFQAAQNKPAPAPSDVFIFAIGPAVDFSITTTTASGGPAWLNVSPKHGTVVPTAPTDVSIRVDPVGLSPGDYYGLIRVDSSDAPNTPLFVTIVLNVVASAQSARASVTPPRSFSIRPAHGDTSTTSASSTSSCVPTKLLPALTLLTDGFQPAVSWPAPIVVDVFDDCAQPMSSKGVVTLDFSNGDRSLQLQAQSSGRWSGTWSPEFPAQSVLITAEARFGSTTDSLFLQGSAEVSTDLQLTPPAPIIGVGGVVSGASYSVTGGRSPGEMLAIFGQNLAAEPASASSLPLPSQLQDTTIVLGGRALPVLFTSTKQVNAVLPYDLVPNISYVMVAVRGTRISVPKNVTLVDADPATFTTNSSGAGQGEVYRVHGSSLPVLADQANPATPGDTLVLYCAGLGGVDASVAPGSAPPIDHLVHTMATVTATIGGIAAPVLSAGLAPGFAGLYQVNLTVPAGAPQGSRVPVVLKVLGNESPPVTMAIK